MLKSPYSYIWFSLCSQKYRRMIKYQVLFFLLGLLPDLPKSSQGWDDCHFFYIFLWVIATLATNKQFSNNSHKKTLHGPQYLAHKFRIKGTKGPIFFLSFGLLKDYICTTLTTLNNKYSFASRGKQARDKLYKKCT